MKLKFKTYAYQTQAVSAVVDCFQGQPKLDSTTYTVDMGKIKTLLDEQENIGYCNARIGLNDTQILENIKTVQKRQTIKGLPQSDSLYYDKQTKCKINLDIEMETGTGKTYCYLKTMYELNKAYGWNKFIIVVPSIAIREGVYQSIKITAEHFKDTYNKAIRSCIYNSSNLQEIQNYSTDSGINVLIINTQAFNSTGKAQRRIYEEQDQFNSRCPIDVIQANNPILILDEPQKMEGTKTLTALQKFNPLMILRYSATHKIHRTPIYRLDAIDAYNNKLVKKISVVGINAESNTGNSAYLYMQGYDSKPNSISAKIEIEQQQKSGKIKRKVLKIFKGDNLLTRSGNNPAYADRYVVNNIDATTDTVDFENGMSLSAGDVVDDLSENTLRRIQIRETIRAHLRKEQQLFAKGIKCLSLFFIDSVEKYRTYDDTNTSQNGQYAEIFEQEYNTIFNQEQDLFTNPEYKEYWQKHTAHKVHNGYFSIDKKTKNMIDPTLESRGENKGEGKDKEAYELILKNKKRLLSFDEPTRFIFSHSALREGWDNPNIFTICTLKNTTSDISRRQELGRGLRLCVDKQGNRQDDRQTAHDINILTVVPSESYKDFSENLQKEIHTDTKARPIKATPEWFTNKTVTDNQGNIQTITPNMARQINRWLIKNDYTDDNDLISDTYTDAINNNTVAKLPTELEPYAESIGEILDTLLKNKNGVDIDDGRKTESFVPNTNLHKKEFLDLWNAINQQASYIITFDTQDLITDSVEKINRQLDVDKALYTIEQGALKTNVQYENLDIGDGFEQHSSTTDTKIVPQDTHLTYDVIGEICIKTKLTRQAVGSILSKIHNDKFAMYQDNPQQFIIKVADLITEANAARFVQNIKYSNIKKQWELNDIFTAENFDISRHKPTKKHVYDYIKTDSNLETKFAKKLETANEVHIYSKLPNAFYIPTPLGKYNPDWAIVFYTGTVKHIYFIAETKGSLKSLDLRGIEQEKINCAKKFFETLSTDNVKYDTITDYKSLMQKVIG